MKAKKTHKLTNQKDSTKNPFIQLAEDKERIAKAFRENDSIATLKGIKLVKPL